MLSLSVPNTIIRKHSNGNVEVYKRHEELGRGGFATVYRVSNQATGRQYALKATSRSSLTKPKILQKHRSEVKIQRELSHPNVLKIYDFFEDSQNTYMVLELCPGRSVRDIVKSKGHLNEQETVKILQDVIDGLCYLHDKRIIHRDLKLENFLIGADKKVKIADFGLSAKLDYDDEKKFTVCGTPNYISPELLNSANNGHSYEVDIWAIGVCAFAMLTGTPPFETKRTRDTYDHIMKCNYRFPSNIRLSSLAKNFIKCVLQIKPECRPSAFELQQHPFLQIVQPYPRNISPIKKSPSPYPFDKHRTSAKKQNAKKETPKRATPKKDNAKNEGIRKESSKKEAKMMAPENINENQNQNVEKKPITKPQSEKKNEANHGYECIPMPPFCISRFCDHSAKYGLGYLLINGTVGAIFNDLSRMIMDPHEQFIQYYPTYEDQTPVLLEKDDINEVKKLSLLQKFAESLKKTTTMYQLPDKKFDPHEPLHHVKYWFRDEQALVFRMEDKNIQVNFNDRTKLVILWHDKKLFMVKNIRQEAEVIPFDDIMKNPAFEEQKNRFQEAKALISKMIG